MLAEDIRHPEKQPNSSKGGRKKYRGKNECMLRMGNFIICKLNLNGVYFFDRPTRFRVFCCWRGLSQFNISVWKVSKIAWGEFRAEACIQINLPPLQGDLGEVNMCATLTKLVEKGF